MKHSPLALAIVLTLGLGTGGRASGEEPVEAIRLDVVSSPGCPDAPGFEALVHARTRRALFVPSGAGLRSIEVRMHAGPHPSGSLVLRRRDIVEGTRSVEAETCADVAEALALVATLAIDPTASSTSVLPAPRASGSPVPPPPPPLPSAAPSAAPPLPPAPAPLLPSAPAPRPVTPRPSSPPGPLPHSLWLGADLATAVGVSRDAMVVVAPSVGWRGPASSSFIAPSIRLGVLRATSGAVTAVDGAASFTWTVGRADGCVLSWPPGPARLLACARFEAGVLQGAGTTVASPRSADRAWVAAGPLLRAEWVLLSPLFVTADLAAMVHVTEDRFYFYPDTTVHQVPVFGLEAGAGLGVHFF